MSFVASLFKAPTLVAVTLFANNAIACAENRQAQQYYEQGIRHYASQEYADAGRAFAQAVRLSPDTAKYHHMLGKSYGRIADQSRGLKAMQLARKILKSFQAAADLDKHNEKIITDLIEYYLQAPAFLGGSEKKALLLKKHLEKLQKTTETGS